MTLPRLPLVLFIALALVYWFSLWTAGFSGDWAVKAAPMLIAAVVLLRSLPARFAWPMSIGFVAAAAGDIFLALDRHEYLMQGLLCFLVTQLAYSHAFWARQTRLRERLAYRLPVILYGLVLLLVMLPTLDRFMAPVIVYVGVLLMMAVLAAGVEQRPGRLYAGAVLFVIADSLIGINRFVAAFPYSEMVIVAIYTTGQYLIFTGALRALRSASPPPR
jgi:uncharacterized membrane protein YhhN